MEDDTHDAAPASNVLPVGPVTIFVCVMGVLAGGGSGLMAGAFYDLSGSVVGPYAGIILGGAGGLLAGVLWCGVMHRLGFRYRYSRARVILAGILAGIGAGCLATAILHAGLMILAGGFAPNAAVVGVTFGVAAGAIVGLICGGTWYKAMSPKARRP